MLSRFLSSFRVPALALSAVLQMMPLVRQALPAFQTSGSLMAIISRWGVGAAAALGSIQAVSGASTVITTPLNQTVTNGVPVGNSQIRLTTAPELAHYWQAAGLPSALQVFSVSSTSWYLRGTPTQTGTFSVLLTAKESATTTNPERVTTATMTLTVLPGGGGNNSPPTATPQSVSLPEDTARSITLSGTDPDGDPLTHTVVSPPSHGTLSGSAPNLTYTPTADYNGPDSFTFRVNDGSLNSPTATVSITVTPVNDAPTAGGQTTVTPEDTPKPLSLSGSDPDGDSLAYTVVNLPTHGTLSGSAPNLTYAPTANYSGSDSFTFRVNDGLVDSSTATVSITVTPVNDPPAADSQSVSTPEDTATPITLSGSDVEGASLTYSILTQPAHGVVSGLPPNLTYTPEADYAGPDSLTFLTSDGALNSTAATISIDVTPVNDPPVAISQTVNTPEDTEALITLSGTDVEGSALTYVLVTPPAHGALSGTIPDLTYTPDAAYSGTDSFTFRVNDGSLESSPATVSINVSSVNSAPVAIPQSISTLENTATPIVLSGSDGDADPLVYTVVINPSHGSLAGTAPNLTYTPDAGYTGTDSFTFKVNDGTLDSLPATVSLSIVLVNDPPTANPQDVLTMEDTATTIALTGSDPDGDPLTVLIVDHPTHGTLSGSAPNVTYTPTANFNGPDAFTFKVNDGSLDSAPATVSVTVTAVNDPPAAASLSETTLSDTPVTVFPLAASTDPDGDALTISSILPTNGTALIQADSSIRFTPAPGFVGTGFVGYTLSDGHGASATGLVTIHVSAVSSNQFDISAGTPALNPQTGLYLQDVDVTHVGSTPVAALRLVVTGLRNSVTLFNRAGYEGADPYVQHNAQINPGETVTFTLEYYVPDRMPFSSTFEARAVPSESNQADPSNAVAISRSFLDKSDPANPRYTIEFTSVPGQTYTIIYSDDMTSWLAASPSITALTATTQWHDDGPPKTISKPGGGSRFYRVRIGQ